MDGSRQPGSRTTPPASAAEQHSVTVIRRRTSVGIDVGELWKNRELLYFLAWRDLKVRYRQSALGALWILLRPAVSVLVYSVLFGRLASFPSDGVPYPLFVLVGLFPWLYFSSTVSGATASIVTAGSLVSKIYFPRVLLPLGVGIANLVDLLASMSLLVVVALYYRFAPPVQVVALPLLILVMFVTTIGPGLFLGAANVRYRDVGQVVPLLLQMWFYMTPVIYPVSFVPERFQSFLYLNPMTGLVEAFRATVLGATRVNAAGLATSCFVSLMLFAAGLFYFKKVEREFADVI